MPEVIWKPIKRAMCDRIGEEVTLEGRVVYPADIFPDHPPRIFGHRCQRAVECNLLDRPTCMWAGSLPGFDPLK